MTESKDRIKVTWCAGASWQDQGLLQLPFLSTAPSYLPSLSAPRLIPLYIPRLQQKAEDHHLLHLAQATAVG